MEDAAPRVRCTRTPKDNARQSLQRAALVQTHQRIAAPKGIGPQPHFDQAFLVAAKAS
jgi:hypothetical protein